MLKIGLNTIVMSAACMQYCFGGIPMNDIEENYLLIIRIFFIVHSVLVLAFRIEHPQLDKVYK